MTITPPAHPTTFHTQNQQEVKKKIAPMAYAALFSSAPIPLFPILFPFPLIFGVLALRDIKRNPEYVGTVRAIFGIIWGLIGAILTAIVLAMILHQP